MPTRGRLAKGSKGTRKRAKQLFETANLSSKAKRVLLRIGFIGRLESERILTMTDKSFLKKALREFEEGKISEEQLSERIETSAGMNSLSPAESNQLQGCPRKFFVQSLKTTRINKKIRVEKLKRAIFSRVKKELRTTGNEWRPAYLGELSEIVSKLTANESRFYTFRQVLTPQETQEILGKIAEGEKRMYHKLQEIFA